MKKLNRVNEIEVIAEFLKNEFFRREFHADREKYEQVVMNPDLANSAENVVRRSLLYRHRGHAWRELPADTQWWVVQLEDADLSRIRILPRGHWSKMTEKKFPSVSDIITSIREHRFPKSTDFDVAKIQSVSYRMRYETTISSVILIGFDEEKPMTILEGNHRLAGALLGSPALLQTRFRIYAGFSARMNEYWLYENTLQNLWRHAVNRLRALRKPEAGLVALPASQALAAGIEDKTAH